jgi:hypothetical protein
MKAAICQCALKKGTVILSEAGEAFAPAESNDLWLSLVSATDSEDSQVAQNACRKEFCIRARVYSCRNARKFDAGFSP